MKNIVVKHEDQVWWTVGRKCGVRMSQILYNVKV